jgi:hypothetical protein
MMQELKILAIGLTAFAIYLPLAYLAGRDFVPDSKPPGAIVEPLLAMVPASQVAYRAQSWVLWKYADASEDNMQSPVLLYEDLTPLGPARSYVRDIYDIGRGRFNFVRFTDDPRSFVTFSTSDNSDPRTNGRRYWLVLP